MRARLIECTVIVIDVVVFRCPVFLDDTIRARSAGRQSVGVFAQGLSRASFNARTPLRAALATFARPIPLAKSCQWATDRLPLERLRDALSCDEVLMMRSDATVLEGLITNAAVIVEEGEQQLALVTPAVDQGILPGVVSEREREGAVAHGFVCCNAAPAEERLIVERSGKCACAVS